MHHSVFKILTVATFMLSASAQADPILLGPGDALYFGTGSGGECEFIPQPTGCDGPGTSHILAWLDANIAGFNSADELYKSDVLSGGSSSDSGPFDSSYDTTFSNGNSDALIQYLGGPAITAAEWLFVKDGNNIPVWYLFDISAWDGVMEIDLNGFWVGTNGSISHVSIFGDTIRVPEPGTLGLFGLGLLGIAMYRSRRVLLSIDRSR